MRKNFTRIIAAVAASFAVLSCMQANLEEEPVNILPNQYVATFESSDDEGSPDTKVSLASDNTTVTWDKGDVIEFISNNGPCVSTWQAGTVDQNGKRAVFNLKSGSAEEQAAFAIYRGLNECCSYGLSTNQPMSITLSMQEQTGLFKDANVMAAKIVDQTIEFKQVFGIFELEVSDSKVKKIVVEGPGVASAVEVTFYKESRYKSIENIKPVGPSLDAITVGNVKPGTWYVAVAPKTYDAGSITISYLDANDAVVTSVKYPNLLTVYRKDIIAFGDISEHTTMSGTLPDGDTFRNYMRQLAGELKNITKISFSRNISNPQGDIEIAKDVYMSYSNGLVSVKTSKSQYTANKDCSSMFDGCYNVTSIHGLSYVNTSATTDMSYMFEQCMSLTSVELDGYFTTANVTNMCDMFWDCEKLEELDLSTWNTRKVTNMNYMFEWNWALEKVILGRNFVIPDGCFADEMLLGCSATWYGTTEEMESFQKNLFMGSDYYDGNVSFAIDMGNAGWWSAWNAGANKPTDFGYYFSWGNSAGHMRNGVSDGYSFTENAYKSTDGYSRTSDWQNAPYCDSQWRMPGTYDFENLVNNCNVSSTTVNGVSGYKFTHKSNGNSIFIPDAGYYADTPHYLLPYYWTREQINDKTAKLFYLKDKSFGSSWRYCGLPVRPIAKMGDVAVTGVSLDKTSLTLEAGGSAQLTATVTPSNASVKSVTWSSSNTSVAKVTATSETTAKVTALASGTTTITATTVDGSKTASIKITVKAKVEHLSGVFSVSAGKQVQFSKGNLVATIDASGTPTAWKFAANQYDCLGEGGANETIGSAAGDVDLFGWSTAATKYGISTSTSEDDYSGDFVDWGKNIGNGSTWRTLSKAEWQYLINKNNDETIRKGKYKYRVTVCGKANCLILAPDDFTGTIETSYNAAAWATAEAAGLVCLPPAGIRDGSNVDHVVGDYGCCYWSSTASGSLGTAAYAVEFGSGFVDDDNIRRRIYGCSVRLITDVK